MKQYLSKEQKEFIYDRLELDYRFNKDLLMSKVIYVDECDLPENYYGDVNVYPYQLVNEDDDWLIDCVTKDFYKELCRV